MPASKNEIAAAEITALAAGAGPPEKTIATRFTLFTTPNCKPHSAGLPSFAAGALLGATGMAIDAQSLGYEAAMVKEWVWDTRVVTVKVVVTMPEKDPETVKDVAINNHNTLPM